MYANSLYGSHGVTQDFQRNSATNTSSHCFYPKQPTYPPAMVIDTTNTSAPITNYPYVGRKGMANPTPVPSYQFNPMSGVSCNPLPFTSDFRPQSISLATESSGQCSSSSTPSSKSNTFDRKCGFVCNESKPELQLIMDRLETMQRSNQTFETNVLNQLRQMREEMSDMRKAIQELPIRFADSLTQCLDLVNNRAECLSVDSEPEVVDVFDKLHLNEDHDFVEIFNKTMTASEDSTAVKKFVFPYDSSLDLDKWLKHD
ncbi:unnamed protein product [Oppiella nova]|uniref:Uncharacterized protein n=1 Tax=Oppiella nova TaxID=334625 RepID=A0A7R9QJ21_9ACAR|nr:unnamed protein product [Oppiella nova]CAG2165981.1 unnamed protein product [Oppiella nova]